MEFKFKKGERVHILFGEMYSDIFRGSSAPQTKGPGLRIKDRRIYQGEAQYKIECFTGWWAERNLVPKSKASKNFFWQDEGSEPITNTQNETKCDTGDSGAFWTFEIPGYAKCSSCGRSFEALPTEVMFKENNKFCRMCGKAMEVKE
jgi:hypothetical protein